MNYANITDIRSSIEKSISTKKALVFTYTKRDKNFPEERKVAFKRIYSRNNNIYAEGFCFKRGANRTFRLDRFNKIIKLEEYTADVPDTSVESDNLTYDVLLEKILYSEEYVKKAQEIVAEFEKRKEFTLKNVFQWLLKAIVLIFLFGTISSGLISVYFPQVWNMLLKPKKKYSLYSYGNYSPIHYIKVKGMDKNYRAENLVKISKVYRQYKINKKGKYYVIKGINGKYSNLYDVIIRINTLRFVKITGIKDKKLISYYVNADIDKNGILSWNEIKIFQNKIFMDFKYIENDIALRPDEFLKTKGGDCEDWALFTAGLLRFWNYSPYIGSLNYKDEYHAITLVKVDKLPYRFRGYRITHIEGNSSDSIPTGLYTYIDYYKVGKLTRSGGRKPLLIRIMKPESCYGKEM